MVSFRHHSSLVILIIDAKYIHFYPTFQIPPILSHCKDKAIHKINRILLVSLQILVKSFVSNIMIDLSYNLCKYIQYKHVWKVFEAGCLHQRNLIACYRLGRNGMLLKFLRILITTAYFKDRGWISKIFCSEFPIFWIRLTLQSKCVACIYCGEKNVDFWYWFLRLKILYSWCDSQVTF